MTEATGNMAQISPEEAGEKPQKKTKKASKAKAAKPEPEKAKAAKPEPEKVAAPEAEPTTNGANKIDELEPQASSTTEEVIPAVEEAAAPTTEREINEKIQKERQEQTQKMVRLRKQPWPEDRASLRLLFSRMPTVPCVDRSSQGTPRRDSSRRFTFIRLPRLLPLGSPVS